VTTVKLLPREVLHVGTEATLRVFHRLARNSDQRYGHGEAISWTEEVDSVGAEFAVAKCLNQYPSGISKVAAPDVGKFVQVRYSPRDDGCLLVHRAEEGDDPEHVFIFVTGHVPEMDVRGWVYGREAQVQTYWRPSNRPCFFVPQSVLRDVSILMAEP
jgi:hypothetical protein